MAFPVISIFQVILGIQSVTSRGYLYLIWKPAMKAHQDQLKSRERRGFNIVHYVRAQHGWARQHQHTVPGLLGMQPWSRPDIEPVPARTLPEAMVTRMVPW